jgi:hypothetical protein
MFGSSGIVRVDQAFPAAVADAISEMIWSVFRGNFGIEQNRPETWGPFRKGPLEKGASSPLFDEIITDRLAGVKDPQRRVGGGGMAPPRGGGGGVVVAPPPAGGGGPGRGPPPPPRGR